MKELTEETQLQAYRIKTKKQMRIDGVKFVNHRPHRWATSGCMDHLYGGIFLGRVAADDLEIVEVINCSGYPPDNRKYVEFNEVDYLPPSEYSEYYL